MKSVVNKTVFNRAKAIVAEAKEKLDDLTIGRPLPVVIFEYPRHGEGTFTTRFVRVTEMDSTHLRGLEIRDEFDDEPGVPKTYLVEKIRNQSGKFGNLKVFFLHMAPETE